MRSIVSCVLTIAMAVALLSDRGGSVALAAPSAIAGEPSPTQIDAYFRPYVVTNNLSGSILIARGNAVLFEKSYGFAVRNVKVPNQLNTRFHIASLSILFTSTAVLRLIDEGKLSFDTHVSDVVAGVPNGDEITIRELLEQNSGLPDVNDLPNYDQLLRSHQTPESVVTQIRGLPPFSRPGGKSMREEHSAENVLALIVERKTGQTFAQAMKTLVFDPFALRDSGVDDDSAIPGPVAAGQHLSGPFGLKPASSIHWSAKPGNGSDYSTVFDELKWLRTVLHGDLLSQSSSKAMLETTDGYGWERVESRRLGETVYLSGGRSPGFSCFLMYLPNEDITIVDLTNIENAANPGIVQGVAALLIGRPYTAFQYRYVSPPLAGQPSGAFVFGPDFYRPSATLRLASDAEGTTLDWPGGPEAPLLPIGRDAFIDRYYWIDVTVLRDKEGNPLGINYRKFHGVPLRN